MRKKQKVEEAQPAITAWDDAEQALRELGLRQIAIINIEGTLNASIDAMKAQAVLDAAPHQAKIKQLQAALELFWMAARKDQKSQKFTFGTLGTRASRAVRTIRNWRMETVIAALQAGMSEFLRSVTKHSIDKERVLAASEDELVLLRKCGIDVEYRETFFAEPDLERIRSSEP